MAYPKRIALEKYKNEDKAIEAHAGFIDCVLGLVRKHGLENVVLGKNHKTGKDLMRIRQSYFRVIEFAENVQLKRIPQAKESEEAFFDEKLPVVRLYASGDVGGN
jgi:hypothetical protein